MFLGLTYRKSKWKLKNLIFEIVLKHNYSTFYSTVYTIVFMIVGYSLFCIVFFFIILQKLHCHPPTPHHFTMTATQVSIDIIINARLRQKIRIYYNQTYSGIWKISLDCWWFLWRYKQQWSLQLWWWWLLWV